MSGSRRLDPDRLPLLPKLIAWLIRLLHGTCRFTVLGLEHEAQEMSHGRPILCACWHHAFPAVIYHFRNRNGMLMVSRSRDGEWIARVLSYLGFLTSRGSPGKGGGVALRRMVAHVRSGLPGGLIADGSQGPALVAQKGILILARQTGASVVPVSMAANPCWRFRSWDRTILAKPFAHVAMAYGSPIRVSRDASPQDLERIRKDLEEALKRLTRQCEKAVNG